MKLKVLKGSAQHIEAQATASDVLEAGGTVYQNIRYDGEWYVYYDLQMPVVEESLVNDLDSELPQIMDEFLNDDKQM